MRESMRGYAYSVQLFILTSTYMHTKVNKCDIQNLPLGQEVNSA